MDFEVGSISGAERWPSPQMHRNAGNLANVREDSWIASILQKSAKATASIQVRWLSGRQTALWVVSQRKEPRQTTQTPIGPCRPPLLRRAFDRCLNALFCRYFPMLDRIEPPCYLVISGNTVSYVYICTTGCNWTYGHFAFVYSKVPFTYG